MLRVTHTGLMFLMVGLTLATGCARSPEAKKARHLERGDAYFKKEQYREAVLEYGNAVRIDAKDARAVRQLAMTHFELGELGLAFPYLVRSKELKPDDLDTRLKLGSVYLLAQKPEEARDEAAAVLEKDPNNFAAVLLSAGTAKTPDEVAGAIRTMESRRSDFGDRAKYYLALGALYARTGDLASTERAFREAIAKDPKSLDAQTLLGNFYVGRGDTGRAEQAYRAAAELAPVGSAVRLNLADFYLSFEKRDEGKRVLKEMTEKASDFLPAWRRLAEVALREGQLDDSLKALQPVFTKNPSDFEGQLLQARVRFAKGETNEAIEQLQKLVKIDPRSAQVRYQLALAHLKANNLHQARNELKEATTADPELTDALLLQAEMDLKAGALPATIEVLEKLLAKRPAEARAWMLLGSAYMTKREPAKAFEAYQKFVRLAPKDPRGPYASGVALRALQKHREARQQFEAALGLSPAHVPSLSQVIAMAFADKAPDVALERVKQEIAHVPQSAPLHHLLGTVHLQRNEIAQAEAAFLKAVQLDPRQVASYFMLAQMYVASRNDTAALDKAMAILKMAPKSPAAHMLIGTVHERRGDFAKAIGAYEQVLAIDPGFASAANNLAYLYAEHGGDKEKALQHAQRAKEAAPDEPAFSDTLGWILYQRGVYQRALGLLKESAAKQADKPEVQYHLGMTHYKLGEKEPARQALNRALKLNPQFPGAAEARSTLAALQ